MRYKARKEYDRTWPVVRRAVAALEADLGRTKSTAGKTHERAKEAVTSEAREGYGRIMPNYVAELDHLRQDRSGAFHDRSTKAVHPHILFFAHHWSRGLLWAGKPAVTTKFFPSNGFRDIASGNSWRSRCSLVFGGSYLRNY